MPACHPAVPHGSAKVLISISSGEGIDVSELFFGEERFAFPSKVAKSCQVLSRPG